MNKFKIKGLTHKICYLDTLFEMYQVNLDPIGYFTKENYASCGQDISEHYDWLVETFNKFPEVGTNSFKDLFSQGVHAYHFSNAVVSLSDNANVEDVLHAFKSCDNEEVKALSSQLANVADTYTEHYLNYFENKKSEFEKRSSVMMKAVNENNFDISSFMEEISGIKFTDVAELANFKLPETVAFYYTFRPIGAMGFLTDDELISTVQGNMKSLIGIVSTPFHEFSHALFCAIKFSDDFKEIAEKLKTHRALSEKWEKIGKQNYDWPGWIEENLVEGFSHFLNKKFRDLYKIKQDTESGTYVIDKKFTDHLTEINFDPNKKSLKEVTLKFLEKVIDKETL